MNVIIYSVLKLITVILVARCRHDLVLGHGAPLLRGEEILGPHPSNLKVMLSVD